MDHEYVLERLQAEIKKSAPAYDLRAKQNSTFMRALSAFLFFSDGFLTRVTTTVNQTVYMPAGVLEHNPERVWKTLTHEWIHILSAQRLSFPVFTLYYLFPQCLAVLSLLSILAIWLSPWWLINLGWLVLLAPLPAPGRAQEELQGFVMALAVQYWLHGQVHEARIEHHAKLFYGPAYYFMWPFKAAITERFHAEVRKIADHAYDTVFPFNVVKEIIDEER